MFWKISCEDAANALDRADGRFVLHRHTDATGPHLDLRLEQDDYLLGWRIDSTSLEGGPWATPKQPHSVFWLNHDGDAVREDAGIYAWVERSGDRCVVLLHGGGGVRRFEASRTPGLPATAMRSVCDALEACGAAPDAGGRLILDGMTARRRAAARLCGLGRELDGAAFDPDVWHRVLDGLSLDEIHVQLRAFEVRFDGKYPPRPVSQPERLSDGDGEKSAAPERVGHAMAIVRE